MQFPLVLEGENIFLLITIVPWDLCEYTHLYSPLLHLLPTSFQPPPKLSVNCLDHPENGYFFAEEASKNSCPVPACKIWEYSIGSVDAAWDAVIP